MPLSTRPKSFVFVLMPFRDEFDDTYVLGIRAACEAAGTYCERVDEQFYQGRILDRIYNQIAKADIIVSDMSGRNPKRLLRNRLRARLRQAGDTADPECG